MITPLKPLKWYRKLSSQKSRLESEAFAVEGDRAIRQIIKVSPESIMEIVAFEDPPVTYQKYPTRILSEKQFQSVCNTRTPQGIMAIVRFPPQTYSETFPATIGNKILLLQDIQDPGNIGTLIRTAAAFGFSGIIMTAGCADPFSPKVVQASAGSILALWLRRTTNYGELVLDLKEQGFIIAAADVHGTDQPSILSGQDKLVLALGNEASGLSADILTMADHCVGIPININKAESLNVAVSGAILMFLAS